jgi:hypothetical protein
MVANLFVAVGVIMFFVALVLGRTALLRSRETLVAGAEHRAPDLTETFFRVFMASIYFMFATAIPAILAILGVALAIVGVLMHFFN